MTLTEALKTLIEAKGIDILKSPLSLNILSDYQAFADVPASKNVLKNIIEEGYLEKIAFFYANELPIGNAAEGYVSEIHNKLGFRLDTTEHVLNAILEALGFDRVSTDTEESSYIEERTATEEQDSAHIKFYGISLGLPMPKFVKELEKKSCILIEENRDTTLMRGDFCQFKNVEIRVWGDEELTSSARVIVENSSPAEYKWHEEYLIDLLTKKYGTPSKAIRNYTEVEQILDFLMFKLIDDSQPVALDYQWQTEGGRIHLTAVIGSLDLDYVDEINSQISKTKNEENELNTI